MLLLELITGYYHATRENGKTVTYSIFNGVRLGVRGWWGGRKNYLMIVRYDYQKNIWVVDADSYHLLGGEDGYPEYPDQQLWVRAFKPLPERELPF